MEMEEGRFLDSKTKNCGPQAHPAWLCFLGSVLSCWHNCAHSPNPSALQDRRHLGQSVSGMEWGLKKHWLIEVDKKERRDEEMAQPHSSLCAASND